MMVDNEHLLMHHLHNLLHFQTKLSIFQHHCVFLLTCSPTSSALATMDLLLALEKELRKRWLAGPGNSFCTNVLHSRHLGCKIKKIEFFLKIFFKYFSHIYKFFKVLPGCILFQLDHLLHGVLGKEDNQGETSNPNDTKKLWVISCELKYCKI